MKASVRDAGKVRIVDLKGKLTLGDGVKALDETVAGLLRGGHTQIVLNLKDVDYIDSAGIGELVASKKRAASGGGDIRLLLPSDSVYQVLSIVQLHLVFQIFDNESKAIGSF
ncbi:MAG: STAS domain-containing protein [Acidobacteriota bacterium]